MIVGIIGKIGHGKDTVADFIRRNSETVYTVRRFADPIKECVASILNCSVFDLEDRNFKERELGPEYNLYAYYRPDTRKPLRVYGSEEGANNNIKFFGGGRVEVIKNTPRRMLQTLGTEWGRDIVHPNIWVNSMMHMYDSHKVNGSNESRPDWLMPDVRFPNEAKAIEERNGILIKVLNPRIHINHDHPSEKYVNKLSSNYTIVNGGSLNELEELTRIAIKELGI